MKKITSVVAAIALCTISSQQAFAVIKTSTYGSGKQIWITADSYSSRSTDGGSPNYVADPAAVATALSGSAYNFPGPPASPPADQQNWWAQYNIPLASLPAGFVANGSTWGFQARTSSANAVAASDESDWLIVNGDASDLNVVNPTDADWLAGIHPANLIDGQPGQRILNNSQIDFGLINYNWGWMSEAYGTGNKIRTKIFNAVDGANIAFRVYEREAGANNDLIDTIVWSTDLQYVPTDADYRNAGIPEPSTIAILATGAFTIAGWRHRRWTT